MINYHYRLVKPKKIVKHAFEEKIDNENNIVVKPNYFSICAADQRYYQGNRDVEILNKKLPLSLIHECVGTIIFSKNKKFTKGQSVLLLPNVVKKNELNDNYDPLNKFRSSSYDGFMQEYIFTNEKQIVVFDEKKCLPNIMVMGELLSVAIHTIKSVEKELKNAKNIAIWGDGNLGYLIYVYLTNFYKFKNVCVFGTDEEKLLLFKKAKTFVITNIDNAKNLNIDIGFECVGGNKSQKAIETIIDVINPTGTIVLLGVSESPIPINTRMVLEKGLTLKGRSRSSKDDFKDACNFLMVKNNQQDIKKIINKIFEINSINDIHEAFDFDYTHLWKTILKWNL